LKSGSSLNNVLQKGVDCLSVVFSLNGAVAELSRGESAGQAHLIVDTIENVIRVEEIVPMAGLWPERRRIGWINQLQAID
jgi:hypothetical protein